MLMQYVWGEERQQEVEMAVETMIKELKSSVND